MRTGRQCKFDKCQQPIRYQLLNAAGRHLDWLCQHHKEAWYDQYTTHKSTLVELTQEGATSEMDTGGGAPREQFNVEPAQTALTRVGVARSQGAPDRMERRTEGIPGASTAESAGALAPRAEGETRQGLARGFAEALGRSEPANLGLTRGQQARLAEPAAPEMIEIRPDGIIYTPWVAVAKRLDEVFGIGNWQLVPEGQPMLQDGFVCWQWHLFCQGKWVSTAIGEHPDPGRKKLSL